MTFAIESREEVFAFQELHHDERLIAFDAVIEDLDDVGAAKLRGGRGLAPEALARIFLLGELGIDQLDGDLGAESEVICNPNERLRALPKRADQAVSLVEDLPLFDHHGFRVIWVPSLAFTAPPDSL